ncbi:hypothetical protein GOBAR_DD25095 [Gossypium barbadense]|nr:hypothetical protein GOBAR_DD25095 [Gossypium barbadense]
MPLLQMENLFRGHRCGEEVECMKFLLIYMEQQEHQHFLRHYKKLTQVWSDGYSELMANYVENALAPRQQREGKRKCASYPPVAESLAVGLGASLAEKY